MSDIYKRGFTGALSLTALGCILVTAAPAYAAQATGNVAAPSTQAPSAEPLPSATSAPETRARGMGDIGYLDGQELVARCSRSDPSSVSYCFAYLAAVTDSARAYEIWLGSREFCLPAGLAQSEIRRAFLSYVSAYPAQTGGQAASVIINALKQTYPCYDQASKPAPRSSPQP